MAHVMRTLVNCLPVPLVNCPPVPLSTVPLHYNRCMYASPVFGTLMSAAAWDLARYRWPLQGAMMGQLELIVQWIPLESLGR